MNRISPTARPALLLAAAVLLPLAACKRHAPANGIDAIDNQLVNGTATAEDATGLRSAIKVDPAHAHGKAPRPAPAASTGTGTGTQGDCLGRYGAQLAYANDWAKKLPEGLTLPPQARLTEAAGHDGGCAIRAVSFTLPGARTAAIDWYKTRAAAAGYAADRADRGGDLMLAGDRGPAAFTVIVGPPAGGATPVDFVWVKSE